MMKKLLSAIFAAALVVCMTVSPALAKGYNDISTTYVRDHYQLLDASTLSQMEQTAAELSDQSNCNVYLLIVNNIGSATQRQYAEAYWNANSLGRGTDKDGILFMIAVDSRDYVTITHGQGETGGITIFTDYRISQIEDDIVAELKNNNWVEGCEVYLSDVQDTMKFYAEKGEPWDSHNEPGDWWLKLVFALVVPLIIAGIICGIWASQMKTAREKQEANDYLEAGSLRLTRKDDVFLHTSRTMMKIEKPQSGGGSSISLSGFGGSSGGKF